jgi:hypothetical protein
MHGQRGVDKGWGGWVEIVTSKEHTFMALDTHLLVDVRFIAYNKNPSTTAACVETYTWK